VTWADLRKLGWVMCEGVMAPGLDEEESNVFDPDEHALCEHDAEEELEGCKAFLASENQGMDR
jgi:hypothetical protein